MSILVIDVLTDLQFSQETRAPTTMVHPAARVVMILMDRETLAQTTSAHQDAKVVTIHTAVETQALIVTDHLVAREV